MEHKRQTTDTALSAGIILLFVALPVELGFAQSIPFWHKECQKFFKQFQTKPKHKAFAVTHMSSGGVSGVACGAAWGASSKAAAETAAIRECQKKRGPLLNQTVRLTGAIAKGSGMLLPGSCKT